MDQGCCKKYNGWTGNGGGKQDGGCSAYSDGRGSVYELDGQFKCHRNGQKGCLWN